MSHRLLIRHATGSKASTVDEFSVTGPSEILFGRDSSCDIRFDSDRDQFVSRRHMKLVVSDPERLEFTVVDLSALNGTFVNRRRVAGSARLQPGDIVQLGAGGPEFTFDVATEDLKVTPVSAIVPAVDLARISPAVPLPESQPANLLPVNEPPALDTSPTANPGPSKASARRPGEYRTRIPKRASLKKRIAGLAVLAFVALAAIGYLVGARRVPELDRIGASVRALIVRGSALVRSSGSPAPKDAGSQNAESLVTVETVWRLVDAATGRPVKQIYIRNRRKATEPGSAPLIPNSGNDLPVFVLLAGNRLQPLLTVADESSYRTIGGKDQSAGFILASDRLILTSRSAAAPWLAPYDWPPADTAGIVVVFDQKLKLAKTAVIARRQFPRWLPKDADFVLEDAFDQDSVRVSRVIRVMGRSDSLTVHLSAARLEAPASVVTASDETGFAAIRLDAPTATRGVAVATDADPRVGDQLVIVTHKDAQTIFGRLTSIDSGERYALSVDSLLTAGAGAPVFDPHGRVIAVQTESDPLRPDRVFAIPIHQALKSVGQTSKTAP